MEDAVDVIRHNDKRIERQVIKEPINGSFASRRCTWSTSRRRINSPWWIIT